MSLKRSILLAGFGVLSIAAIQGFGFNDEGRTISLDKTPYTDAEIVQMIEDILPGEVGAAAIEAKLAEVSTGIVWKTGGIDPVKGSTTTGWKDGTGGMDPTKGSPGIVWKTGVETSIDCFIMNHDGNVVTQVEEARIGEKSYWMAYLANGANADFVWFVTQPVHGGNPLERQIQMFRPVSDTDIETPLAIPHWQGDATTGDWMIVVYNDLGDFDIDFFEVVAK